MKKEKKELLWFSLFFGSFAKKQRKEEKRKTLFRPRNDGNV